ncbi:hypothetical protein [Streptomyces sp. NPDC056975]|uniref:hypothetical protein n=1 Tax=unclassified Streptomyces TaxID=2593676 RepID=UPI00363387EE
MDLELSAHDGETWHLSACVVVADDLGPVSKWGQKAVVDDGDMQDGLRICGVLLGR